MRFKVNVGNNEELSYKHSIVGSNVFKINSDNNKKLPYKHSVAGNDIVLNKCR